MLSGFEGFEGSNEEQWKRKWYSFVPPDGVRDSVGDEAWITFRSILPHGTWVAWGMSAHGFDRPLTDTPSSRASSI
jgi:hypothetical protein